MIIDCHVHLAGTGSDSDCTMSDRLRKSPAYLLMLVATGQIFHKVDDESIREHILDKLRPSKLVDRAVFLSLDRVHDGHGNPDPGRTHLYTPNDYTAALAASEEKVLFGASVHPDRPDALDELDRVADLGAVLVKWLPSAQDIDPMRPRYAPFYAKLAELDLPLLCHVGPEHAIPAAGPEDEFGKLNHPDRLRAPLEAGVTVIAAHCCTPVFSRDEDTYDDFVALMDEAVTKDWRLYGDLSALAAPLPHRVKYISRVKDDLPHDRLLLGSDYPIPVSSLWPGAAGEVDLGEWAEAALTTNPFDLNVKMLRAFGFDECVTTNAETVLRMP